ncbi:citrate/2-methylcitrate synthase [Actinophytocola sp.]|uniref:citrate/2-methylcitrate synthase n=1 Tax=Actinophytocola sp. TaxID=1872138 RepID=UPI003D6B66D6
MSETITITHDRSGRSERVPITGGTVDVSDWHRVLPDVSLHDPALRHTSGWSSGVTRSSAEHGRLYYRGYPADELAESSTYLETAYLLLHGELPDAGQLAQWRRRTLDGARLDAGIHPHLRTFGRDGRPMGMLISALGYTSALRPDARDTDDARSRHGHAARIVGMLPALVADIQRARSGRPPRPPVDDLSPPAGMLYQLTGRRPDTVAARALETLFILQADHEQSCSTTAMRVVGSAHADPYSCVAAACAAMDGSRHGGAAAETVAMFRRIHEPDRAAGYIHSVIAGGARLHGFGHRVYKRPDPRVAAVRALLDRLAATDESRALYAVATEVERAARSEDYFVSRNLFPNLDFYLGIGYLALGVAPELYTVAFAAARVSGWVAHWCESREREDGLVRPRQRYVGRDARSFSPDSPQ